MSKKSFKKSTMANRVVAMPSRKVNRVNEDGKSVEVQLYKIKPIR